MHVESTHEQLPLLPADDRPWKLDPHTREVGRRGIEAARAILREAAGADRGIEGVRRPVGRMRSERAARLGRRAA